MLHNRDVFQRAYLDGTANQQGSALGGLAFSAALSIVACEDEGGSCSGGSAPEQHGQPRLHKIAVEIPGWRETVE